MAHWRHVCSSGQRTYCTTHQLTFWCHVCVQFSPEGSRLITASSDKTCRVWSADTGTQKLPRIVFYPTQFRCDSRESAPCDDLKVQVSSWTCGRRCRIFTCHMRNVLYRNAFVLPPRLAPPGSHHVQHRRLTFVARSVQGSAFRSSRGTWMRYSRVHSITKVTPSSLAQRTTRAAYGSAEL
jgi:hypothetical protein